MLMGVLLSLIGSACVTGPSDAGASSIDHDAGHSDGGASGDDGPSRDAGLLADGGRPAQDAGRPDVDAGVASDAGAVADAGSVRDAGHRDAGAPFNAPPTPPVTVFTENTAYEHVDLVCQLAGPSADPDGDVLLYTMQVTSTGHPDAFIDGITTQPSVTVPAELLSPGDELTCTADVTDGDNTVVGPPTSVIVAGAPLAAIEFVSVAPTSIGVRGSDTQSLSAVTFRAVDEAGASLADVAFTFSVPATADPLISVVPTDLTGEDGLATTFLSAGTRAGQVVVLATAQLGTTIAFGQSEAVSMLADKPSAATSYFSCEPAVVRGPAFSTQCTLTLADMHTNATMAPSSIWVEGRDEPILTPSDQMIVIEGSVADLAPSSLLSPAGASAGHHLSASTPLVDAADPGHPDHGNNTFVAADCLDDTSATPCNLIALCQNGGNDDACPLPMLDDGDRCSDGIAVRALLPNPDDPPIDLVGYTSDASVAAIVDDYLDGQRRCGWRTSCLIGDGTGLPFFSDDDCLLARGCFDFSAATPCPTDGALDLVVAFEGREGFVDVDGDHMYLPGEPLIDLPEPFLDKQSNGAMDDYTGNPRLTPEMAAHQSDILLDTNGNGVFDGPNGVWDHDRVLFIQTAIVLAQPPLDADEVLVGQPCAGSDAASEVSCSPSSLGTANCREVSPDAAFADCFAAATGAVADQAFRVMVAPYDVNGNCIPSATGSPLTIVPNAPLVLVGATPPASVPDCALVELPDARQPWRYVASSLGGGQAWVEPICSAAGAAVGTIDVLTDGAVVGAASVPISCP